MPGSLSASVDFLVEQIDDFLRRSVRRADAEKRNSFIARHGFGDGRHIRQFRRALRRGHRQRAQFAGSDVGDRRWQIVERNLHLAAEQIGQHRRRAFIRYVRYLQAGHHLEQFAG